MEIGDLKRNLERKRKFKQAQKQPKDPVQALTDAWKKEATREDVRAKDRPVQDYVNWTDRRFV